MSEKKSIEELLRRLDESLIILRDVLGDLQEISKSLRSAAVAQPPSGPTTQPALPSTPPKTPTPIPALRKRGVEDVRMMFPQELEDLLTFTETEDHIVIKPRQYLGSENFAKIASIIRGAGGEYISAGKDSHFRVPKQF
jgi:hypothetical protein